MESQRNKSQGLRVIGKNMRARWAALVLIALTLALTGCQSAPPAPQPAGLSAAQVAVLKEEGFTQTDDGWAFGLADKVLFETDADTLKADGQVIVARIGRALLGVGITHLRVDGYTDSEGSDAYNLRLSENRADAVAALLASVGLPRGSMQTRGLGKKNPVADNSTAAGRLENRRVAIVVSAP